MKKIFIILFATIFSVGVFAQAQFGGIAGLNMSNISGDDAGVDGMKIGMHVGISASFELSDAAGIQTGAVYSMKGSSEEEDGVTGSINLSYIEIPMNITFAASDQVSLMAGPYIGLLMSAKVKISGAGDMDGEADIKDDVAPMDFGINVGASFAVTETMSINAGYQIGLTALDEDGDSDSKNSNMHIGITYSFGG